MARTRGIQILFVIRVRRKLLREKIFNSGRVGDDLRFDCPRTPTNDLESVAQIGRRRIRYIEHAHTDSALRQVFPKRY
jgi:hypothetical protein